MIGTGMGMLIAGLAAGGGGIYAAKKQGSAAERAQALSGQSLDKQIAWEREQAAEDKRRYDEEVALLRQRHEAEQTEINRKAALEEANIAEERRRFELRQEQMRPYRDQGLVSLSDLAGRARAGTPASTVPGMTRDPYAVMQAPQGNEYVSPYDPRMKMADFAKRRVA